MDAPAPVPAPSSRPGLPPREAPPAWVLPPGVRTATIALLALVSSTSYGLVSRLIFGSMNTSSPPSALDKNPVLQVMTVAFIFLVPLAIGFLTTAVTWLGVPLRWWWRLGLPPLAGLLALVCAMAMAFEGLICIVMWSPVYMGLILIGSALAEAAFQLKAFHDARLRAVLCILVGGLPYGVGALEGGRLPPREIRTVATSVDVAASPEMVWREVREVRRIDPSELPPSSAHRMGFPRPVEARLVGEGVGATRLARFEGNVVFVEKVTAWDPPREIAFTISADPERIPSTTLDAHVTVGGPYFDVLEGRFRIEELGKGAVRLHLASRHRVSTPFNFYAHAWTDFVMADVQRTILEVIRARCEAPPAGVGSS